MILSGNDIPFPEAGISIHQPTIKEIGIIGEENFYCGCEFLNFSKNNLEEKDKISLEDKTDFDILMTILKEKNSNLVRNRICVEMVLSLIFPNYNIKLNSSAIVLSKDDNEFFINNKNFKQFKTILNEIFCLKQGEGEREYNPAGELAKKIADKLKARQKKLAQLKGQDETKEINMLGRFISILSVGESKDMNSFFNYTIYQLLDEFNRYELKLNYDVYFQAKLAGAKDLKEVDDWMKDIHQDKE